jgi:hypothetical protein
LISSISVSSGRSAGLGVMEPHPVDAPAPLPLRLIDPVL